MKIFAMLALVFGFGCTGAGYINEDEHTSEKSNASTSADLAIQNQLQSLPHWAQTSLGFSGRQDFSTSDINQYKNTAINLQSFSVSQLKSGIEYSLENASSDLEYLSLRSNVFVLLRFIFDVPQTIDLTNGGYVSPYASFSVGAASASFDPKSFNILWPVDFSGTATSVANFMGVFGGEYDPLKEIDFISSYGYRSL